MLKMIRQIANYLVRHNIFISLCVTSMVLTTYLFNRLGYAITSYTLFIFFSSFIIYNFHNITYLIDYSSVKNIFSTAAKLNFSLERKIFLLISGAGAFITFMLLPLLLKLFLLPVIL